jgi:hypothetical protein
LHFAELLVLLVPCSARQSRTMASKDALLGPHNVIARRNGPVGTNMGGYLGDDGGDITGLVSPLSLSSYRRWQNSCIQCMHRCAVEQYGIRSVAHLAVSKKL